MTVRPITILLVEDNPADARLVQLLLADARALHYTLVHVDRLATAVETLTSGCPVDAILLDLGLPDGQGLTTVTRLRGVAPRVPIVIMSGNDDEAVAVAGVRDGAQDYLVKGRVEADGLARALRYAIERQEAETRLAAALETQQEANRQLARLNKAKSDFVSIVGHEFRTPLTGILGFSEIMRDEEISPVEVREYAGDINADAARLIRLITEMLDLDRMEAGQVTLRREMVDVRTLVVEVAALARRTAPRHAI
ncbi:MAG: hybrid sensor histidine kinase/response regulator, partial [Chloroflexi bacterium]|nr:hybrid sensor histidine kinase/response regulator [Chloroflexota bacterium]